MKPIKANDARVEEISDERATGDGIWFYLKPGWIWGEVHFVHEDTVRECREALRIVEPCACAECEVLKARAAATPRAASQV